MNKIRIEILDSKFRKIESGNNLSFTMNIISKLKKLKNTEINTTTNSIASNGLIANYL